MARLAVVRAPVRECRGVCWECPFTFKLHVNDCTGKAIMHGCVPLRWRPEHVRDFCVGAHRKYSEVYTLTNHSDELVDKARRQDAMRCPQSSVDANLQGSAKRKPLDDGSPPSASASIYKVLMMGTLRRIWQSDCIEPRFVSRLAPDCLIAKKP